MAALPLPFKLMSKKHIFITVGLIAAFLLAVYFVNPRHGKTLDPIKPGATLESVVKSLGDPIEQQKEEGMTLYCFKESFGASGPIRVGFDAENRAVYLKVWEDSPPEWDLRPKKK